MQGVNDVFELSKKDNTYYYHSPFRSEWFTANSASLNDDLILNQEQLGRLG